MSWEIRPFRGRTDQWEYDIRTLLPSGERYRERRKAPAETEREAARFAEKRERHLNRFGVEKEKPALAPTLKEFAPRWLRDYCVGDRRCSPGTLTAYASRLDARILPHLGDLRLDRITNAEISRLRGALAAYAVTSVNGALIVLGKILKTAVKWGEIEGLPCQIERAPEPQQEMAYYPPELFEQILAKAEDAETRAILFLGGEAGLRVGEIQALKWAHVDLKGSVIRVQESRWRGQDGPTKGKRARSVDLTPRLVEALKAIQHLRGPYVICHTSRRWCGKPLSRNTLARRLEPVQSLVARELARKKAPALVEPGKTHVLRHTFCSRLAAAGAPAKAIQELAGHASLTTTQKYMHLSPRERRAAALLLAGEIRETDRATAKDSRDFDK